MTSKRIYSHRGFTLAEIMAVVIIIGLLASIALPKYNTYLVRTRYGEGVQVLNALKEAQINYHYEHNAYASNAQIGALDVQIPGLQNFNAPTLATANPIASVAEKNGNYALSIDDNGTIHCAGASCAELRCTGGGAADECN